MPALLGAVGVAGGFCGRPGPGERGVRVGQGRRRRESRGTHWEWKSLLGLPLGLLRVPLLRLQLRLQRLL